MRNVSLVNRIEFDFKGNVVRKGLTFGDVDNDGEMEFIIGNSDGEVVVLKVKQFEYDICVINNVFLNKTGKRKDTNYIKARFCNLLGCWRYFEPWKTMFGNSYWRWLVLYLLQYYLL